MRKHFTGSDRYGAAFAMAACSGRTEPGLAPARLVRLSLEALQRSRRRGGNEPAVPGHPLPPGRHRGRGARLKGGGSGVGKGAALHSGARACLRGANPTLCGGRERPSPSENKRASPSAPVPLLAARTGHCLPNRFLPFLVLHPPESLPSLVRVANPPLPAARSFGWRSIAWSAGLDRKWGVPRAWKHCSSQKGRQRGLPGRRW